MSIILRDAVLAKLETARQALAEAKTIQETKKILDVAAAAEIYAKRQHLGEQAVNYATSIKLEALKQLGNMLKDMPKSGPKYSTGGGSKGSKREPLPDAPPTLADLGLDKKTSKLAQDVAALPEEKFKAVADGLMALSRAQNEVKRDNKKEELNKISQLPEAKYRIIYADPPWSYGDKCDAGSIQSGGAEKHYPSMSIQDLCDMKIGDITGANAVLFLWVTSPLLEECFEVIKAWGFKYKASFVWDKIKHNMGHYNSVRHELLLICTKGSCLPDNAKLVDSVQSIERTTHSTKPEEFRQIIDMLYTTGKRIELFARKKTKGWDTYGNES